MKTTAVALVALSLAACAIWPAGEDPKGQDLKKQATPVLAALVAYRKDNGGYPTSLYELVPRYLREVPFSAHLQYAREQNVIGFAYSPSWPQDGDVQCVAHLGDLQWSCTAS